MRWAAPFRQQGRVRVCPVEPAAHTVPQPGGLGAARVVFDQRVGHLWPVSDSGPAITVMTDFHRRLASAPSHAALPSAIAAARDRGIR